MQWQKKVSLSSFIYKAFDSGVNYPLKILLNYSLMRTWSEIKHHQLWLIWKKENLITDDHTSTLTHPPAAWALACTQCPAWCDQRQYSWVGGTDEWRCHRWDRCYALQGASPGMIYRLREKKNNELSLSPTICFFWQTIMKYNFHVRGPLVLSNKRKKNKGLKEVPQPKQPNGLFK